MERNQFSRNNCLVFSPDLAPINVKRVNTLVFNQTIYKMHTAVDLKIEERHL